MIVPQLQLQCPLCGHHLEQIRDDCPRCQGELQAWWPAVVRPLQAYSRAVELVRSGKIAAAQRDAYLAVALEPHRFEFRWLFSCLLAETGEFEEAIAQGQAAWELAPENTELQQWLESLFALRFARAAEVAEAEAEVEAGPEVAGESRSESGSDSGEAMTTGTSSGGADEA